MGIEMRSGIVDENDRSQERAQENKYTNSSRVRFGGDQGDNQETPLPNDMLCTRSLNVER
jgi:hypothetical protein